MVQAGEREAKGGTSGTFIPFGSHVGLGLDALQVKISSCHSLVEIAMANFKDNDNGDDVTWAAYWRSEGRLACTSNQIGLL